MKTAKPSQLTLLHYALFGGALAFAGPPVYIHVPKLYTEQHSISLAGIAGILLALRAIDFIQDPVLGWMIEKYRRYVSIIALCLGVLLCFGMLILFLPNLPLQSEIWLSVSLICVFTGFSGLQILYYSTGVALAGQSSVGQQSAQHSQIASWREAGILLGICTACVAPTLFATNMDVKSGYFAYALSFAVFLVITLWLMRGIWQVERTLSDDKVSITRLLKDNMLKRLLMIGFINTLPVGLTATLFLFYVDDRLNAANEEAAIMLLLFFLCAALAAPFWGTMAKRFGMKPVLLIGMSLSIAAFSMAWPLTPENYYIFYIVCALSGAALGADMTLLPAMLSARLGHLGAGSAQVFGIWGFVNKATLALAAAVALPILQWSGYNPGQANADDALHALSFMYAALPCLLKLFAIAALYATRFDLGDSKL